VDPATVDDDYSTETVTSWDSVHHLQLLLAIEDEFDLRFDVEEIADLTSFGAIRQRVEAAVGAGSRQE
jgi:acyl carrier protein